MSVWLCLSVSVCLSLMFSLHTMCILMSKTTTNWTHLAMAVVASVSSAYSTNANPLSVLSSLRGSVIDLMVPWTANAACSISSVQLNARFRTINRPLLLDRSLAVTTAPNSCHQPPKASSQPKHNIQENMRSTAPSQAHTHHHSIHTRTVEPSSLARAV